jgi:TPP-dependent indolepyruvate ferredoxin oxidoreductase alpha subunit
MRSAPARSRCSSSTSPARWCPEQLAAFCIGKRGVLVVEEGQPEYIEQEVATLLRRRDIQTPLHGKDMLPAAGEYSIEVLAAGCCSSRVATCRTWTPSR